MSYAVKEMFLTLQGEGLQAGMRAVFVRFAGCNLWSGREEDRATADCTFCDTDFVGTDGQGGGKFATADLIGLPLRLRLFHHLAGALVLCADHNAIGPFEIVDRSSLAQKFGVGDDRDVDAWIFQANQALDFVACPDGHG